MKQCVKMMSVLHSQYLLKGQIFSHKDAKYKEDTLVSKECFQIRCSMKVEEGINTTEDLGWWDKGSNLSTGIAAKSSSLN